MDRKYPIDVLKIVPSHLSALLTGEEALTAAKTSISTRRRGVADEPAKASEGIRRQMQRL